MRDFKRQLFRIHAVFIPLFAFGGIIAHSIRSINKPEDDEPGLTIRKYLRGYKVRL